MFKIYNCMCLLVSYTSARSCLNTTNIKELLLNFAVSSTCMPSYPLFTEQVYKGVTLDGDEVAIKVQYIDLRDRFMFDMKALVFLFRTASVIHPKFDLYWIVDVSIQFVLVATVNVDMTHLSSLTLHEEQKC